MLGIDLGKNLCSLAGLNARLCPSRTYPKAPVCQPTDTRPGSVGTNGTKQDKRVFWMALERIAHGAVGDRCTAGFRAGL
jgi:hypothetical protein